MGSAVFCRVLRSGIGPQGLCQSEGSVCARRSGGKGARQTGDKESSWKHHGSK